MEKFFGGELKNSPYAVRDSSLTLRMTNLRILRRGGLPCPPELIVKSAHTTRLCTIHRGRRLDDPSKVGFHTK